MAELTNPIMTATQQNGNTTYVGRIGAKATDVQTQAAFNGTSYQWKGSLQSYIDQLDNFFQSADFMYHGEVASDKVLPSQVKFWYDTNPYFITQQPQNCIAPNNGDQITFFVETNDEEVQYQWQTSSDQGVSWVDSNLLNNKQQTFGPFNSTVDRRSYLYRCKLKFQNNVIIYSKVASVVSS